MGDYADDLFRVSKLVLHNRTEAHIDFLGSILGCKKKAKDAIFYSYRRHINGFAAQLDEAEVAVIRKNPMVVTVFRNEERQLKTTNSWDFLSLGSNGVVPPDSLWKKARFGQDVIIGSIDTGVWPESASFHDEGFGPIPQRWKGSCDKDKGAPFPCNRKLIGAKYFYEGFVNKYGRRRYVVDTARDYIGHGTHTLSTAGGNFVPGASVFGMYNGTARGGAPKARVATYKVCWPVCVDADILKAFDHAIDDGVDIISISMGGSKSNYYDGSIEIGAFTAIRHGITVVAAAGNEGPAPGTVGNLGTSLWKGVSDGRMYPLVRGEDARTQSGSAVNASACEPGSLDPDKVKGKILVCLDGRISTTLKGDTAAKAGAIGMIICNHATASDIFLDHHVLHTVHLNYTDGLAIYAYMNSTKNPMALITSTKVDHGVKPAPVVADFSSRGPNKIKPEILKPDIIAPGVDIMAAYTEATSPSGLPSDPRRTKYAFMSGTSMACPTAAAIVALLKVLHPHWSPAAIRSALMTTATTLSNTHRPILDGTSSVEGTPFTYGAGLIRPNLAADPGLVYDLSMRDYEMFLCGIGYNETIMRTFTDSYTCPLIKPNILNFNYPSITVPALSGSVTVSRVLKNVGSPGTYVAEVRPPLGVLVSVKPNSLQFTKIGDERKFELTLTLTRNATSAAHDVYTFGDLIWSDGRHKVRSPIVVRATPASNHPNGIPKQLSLGTTINL
ncbi:Subtilisin-like protease SBT5.4 [Sesamum alatum]|uniref:Subtilisin-like protease SBT5.4 n=1 Tax=Sesamum alatum TaxID=300844 RepID=A0AAE1YWZ4_9LAMI|nr:Subtilisin-like protease SBT5.4 [Sesamum alatum]